jgi:hypothetical protein
MEGARLIDEQQLLRILSCVVRSIWMHVVKGNFSPLTKKMKTFAVDLSMRSVI